MSEKLVEGKTVEEKKAVPKNTVKKIDNEKIVKKADEVTAAKSQTVTPKKMQTENSDKPTTTKKVVVKKTVKAEKDKETTLTTEVKEKPKTQTRKAKVVQEVVEEKPLSETKEYKMLKEKISKNDKYKIDRQKQKTLATLLLVVWSVSLFIFGYAVSLLTAPSSNEANQKLEDISKILTEEWYYYDQFEDLENEIYDNALYGMTSFEIDPHTTYLSAEDMQAFQTSLNQNYVGIGVQYISANNTNIITNVFKGSPADTAGIQSGDIINKIDGSSVDGLTSDEIKNLVQGTEGSTVTIEVIRGKNIESIDIVRGAVTSTVESELLENNTGYVEVMSFGSTTGTEFRNHVQDLVNQGATKLIIDLRGNSGGYLTTLVEVAGVLLPKGSIAMQQVSTDGTIEVFETTAEPIDEITNVVIITDNNSASASEAFTLAMRENFPNTFVVGEETFGKGTVQTTETFVDGSAIKYTTAQWQSSMGLSLVNGEGILPDFEVEGAKIINESLMVFEDDLIINPGVENPIIAQLQDALFLLGYDSGRSDGYFSIATLDALNKYQTDYGITSTNIVDQDVFMGLISEVYRQWELDTDLDIQLRSAYSYLNQN